MQKKVMLITGTSRGIGKALAEYYMDDYTVIGCGRFPVGSGSKYIQTDLSTPEGVYFLFDMIRDDKVDILINNAGIAKMNHSLTTTVASMQDVFNLNFAGTFICSQMVMRSMIAREFGRIINFSSVAVPLALEGELIYAASKSAIETCTKIMAKELGGFGITVNAVGISPTKTDLIKSVPEEKMNRLLNSQAIKRYCEFSDIWNITDFLIRPESNFITGQTIYLGGV